MHLGILNLIAFSCVLLFNYETITNHFISEYLIANGHYMSYNKMTLCRKEHVYVCKIQSTLEDAYR